MTKLASIADDFIPALSYKRDKLTPRTWDPVAVVYHTTGGGVPARWARQGERFGEATPLDTAGRVYGRIMPACPHLVVGQCGGIIQTVPDDYVAWHVGSRYARRYARGEGWIPKWERDRYAWWRARWRGLVSPADLAGGAILERRAGLPLGINPNVLGVEVVAPVDDPRGAWSPEAWASLARIARYAHTEYGIPLRREFHPTHSDTCPLTRTTKSGTPWDPGPRQWSWARLWNELNVQ